MENDLLHQAATLIAAADSLVITAGAGMGVDSGLPDFRGPEGFWGVYPGLGRARLHFEDIANPLSFRNTPKLAWGFYGHRLAMYRRTEPHPGFLALKAMASAKSHGAFVFTSNVDGQFQQAGFAPSRICEVHGSIHHLQCLEPCSESIWSAQDFLPEVDEANCLLCNEPPHCPRCGGLARPNILMFGDWNWIERRQTLQYQALHEWLGQASSPVVIEIGAGTAIPTVRKFGENLSCPLIRINRDASRSERSNHIILQGNASGLLVALAQTLGVMPHEEKAP